MDISFDVDSLVFTMSFLSRRVASWIREDHAVDKWKALDRLVRFFRATGDSAASAGPVRRDPQGNEARPRNPRLTLQEAESFARSPKEPDLDYLRAHYSTESYAWPPSLDAFDPDQPLDEDSVKETAKQMYDHLGPLARKYISLDLAETAAREHVDSASELAGDWPTRTKKWTIWVLPEYANQLADVAFVAFRLDSIDARTVRLPSGSHGIILNNSVLITLPSAASAYLSLYYQGSSQPGSFGFGSSPDTSFLINSAKHIVDPTPASLEKLLKTALELYGIPAGAALQIGLHCSLYIALHECAHILNGHSEFVDRLSNEGGDYFSKMQASWKAEIQADCFALERLLNIDAESLKTVDEVSREQHQLKVCLAVSLLFVLLSMIEAYAGKTDDDHPSAELRWRHVRLVIAHYTDPMLARRLDFMANLLRTMQAFNVQ